MKRIASAALPFFVAAFVSLAAWGQGVEQWRREFPKGDFSKTSIDHGEITFDGNRRDDIPPIDDPEFVVLAEVEAIDPLEPVLSIGIDGDFRAYPLRVLLWHEIVNDVVGGVPVLVSYCPLCNSGVVFDRRVAGRTLEFGNTGRLRHYDMVMYDRETESWWQQLLGEALMGELTGTRMTALPARLESLGRFRERAPEGRVLVPNDPSARAYGMTPFLGVDSTRLPRGEFGYDLPEAVEPIARVVVVEGEAWTLDLLRRSGRIERGSLVLTWEPGQLSIHDTMLIAEARDVGNVVVRRRTASGLEDVPYDVVFAFVFGAFHPDGTLHYE